MPAGAIFTAMLIDSKMPDAMDLANRIRQNNKQAIQNIVLLTPVSEVLDPEMLDKLGIAACLTKPVGQSQLFDTLMMVVNGIDATAANHLKQLELKNQAISQEPNAPGNTSTRVLLIEDNTINQMVAGEVLSQAGYQFDLAANGLEAIDSVTTKAYDLILMDCQMPEMDGFEATHRIRQLEQEGRVKKKNDRRMPIIALTANAVKGDREKCLNAGMDDYLTKPLDPQRLADAIRSHLNPQPHKPLTGHGSQPDAEAKPPANPPANPAAGEPINIEEALQRCMGNVQLLAKMIDKFKERSILEIQQLGQLIEDQDASSLTSVAHSLKGAAANLSIREMCILAGELETIGREGELAQASACLDRLRAAFDQFIHAAPKALAQATENRGQPR